LVQGLLERHGKGAELTQDDSTIYRSKLVAPDDRGYLEAGSREVHVGKIQSKVGRERGRRENG